MAVFEILTDRELYERCNQERENASPGMPSACHELLCRAFVNRSSEAVSCVLESYGAEFTHWITNNTVYPQLESCVSTIEPADILQDILAKLFWRVEQGYDCYGRFPNLKGFFFFIKQSIKNYEIDLLKRCRFTQLLGEEIPWDGWDNACQGMEQAEVRIQELLTVEEDLVYQFWIYGLPSREEILRRLGKGDRKADEQRLNTIKRRVRGKLYQDDALRAILGLPEFDG